MGDCNEKINPRWGKFHQMSLAGLLRTVTNSLNNFDYYALV